MEGESEKCMTHGMSNYISKSINANLPFEKIYTKMLKSEFEKSIDHKNYFGENMFDLSYLSSMVGGRKNVIKEIIDVFLKQVPEELKSINDAISKTDYATIKRFAHSMKTSVSVMGISILEPVLQEIEDLGTMADNIEKIRELNLNLNLICKQVIGEIEKEQQNYI